MDACLRAENGGIIVYYSLVQQHIPVQVFIFYQIRQPHMHNGEDGGGCREADFFPP